MAEHNIDEEYLVISGLFSKEPRTRKVEGIWEFQVKNIIMQLLHKNKGFQANIISYLLSIMDTFLQQKTHSQR